MYTHTAAWNRAGDLTHTHTHGRVTKQAKQQAEAKKHKSKGEGTFLKSSLPPKAV